MYKKRREQAMNEYKTGDRYKDGLNCPKCGLMSGECSCTKSIGEKLFEEYGWDYLHPNKEEICKRLTELYMRKYE